MHLAYVECHKLSLPGIFIFYQKGIHAISWFSAYFSEELNKPITTQLPSNADTEPQYTHHFLVKTKMSNIKKVAVKTSLHTVASEGWLALFSGTRLVPFGPGTFISERTNVSNVQATSLVRNSEDTSSNEYIKGLEW